MQIIEAVLFPDNVVEPVQRLLTAIRLVAGKSSVFRANDQIRAAVEGATETHKGHGIFLMIEPRKNGAVIWFPPELGLANKHTPLTDVSLTTIVEDMRRSFEVIKAKLEASRRGAITKTATKHPTPTTRNPTWTRDELILTLDVYFRVPPWTVNSSHPEIVRLSEELQRLSAHVDPPDAGRYRNLNGTYMKLMNFQSLDPSRGGRGLKGAGRADREVWNDYSERRKELSEDAAAIRVTLDNPELLQIVQSTLDDDDITEAREGRVLTRLHRSRERDPKLAKAKRNQAMKKHGALKCAVCLFDFFERYGELGFGYLECHHILHLSLLPENHTTKLEHLALVCANCHRMLHRKRDWLSIEALRELLKAA